MTNKSLIDSLMKNSWCATLVNGGSDKESPHSYISHFYQTYFDFYRPKRILEVGVRNGFSVRLWLTVEGVECIVGLDSDPLIASPNESIEDKRYEFFLTDAYSSRRRKDVLRHRKFDLIIDDGPHSLITQMNAAKEFTKLLAPGGTLVIEDIQNPDNDVSLIVASLPLFFRGKVSILDLRMKSGKPDSFLIIIQSSSLQCSKDPIEIRGIESLRLSRKLIFIKARILLYRWKVTRFLWLLNHLPLFKELTRLSQVKGHS